MVRKGKRTATAWIALFLALLFLLPAPGVLAAEEGSALSAEADTQVEESSLDENSVSVEESTPSENVQEGTASGENDLEEGTSSESSQEESVSSQLSQEETQSGEESETSEESSEEEASSLENTEEETYGAYPLLVVGGHDAYMSGESGARFYPNRSMTRAEMAQVLYNLLAAKLAVTKSSFTDVDSGDWYYTAVNSLAQTGVLNGYEDGTFRPNQSVTRAEFVTALSKCFTLSSGSVPFPDVGKNHWAYKYIASAVAKGWINGFEDNTFRPDAEILRCQVPVILNEALERTGDGFASDRYTQEFVDVPSSHWAFLDIAEAADPVGGGGNSGTGLQKGQILRVTADGGLRLRSGPGTSYTAIGSLSKGSLITALAAESGGWIQVSTSDGKTGYVSTEYVEFYSEGTTTDPDPDPDPNPGGDKFAVGQTVRVTADNGLRLRSGPGTNYDTITLLSTGSLLTVTSVESNGWLGVTTQVSQKGYVSSDYVEVYNGGSTDPGTASGAKLSASKLSLAQYQTVRLDGSVDSNLAAMTWSSSNSSVAVVGYTIKFGSTRQGAMIYGKSPGTATITFTDKQGATATCTVTVTAAESVRYAYAEENIVAVNTPFNLVGVTDSSRTAVRFQVVNGNTYETTSYTTESRNSSYGLPTNSVKVFKQSVTFSKAGTYTVRAYSKTASGWSSSYTEFTVMVTSSDIHSDATTTDSRRASTEGLHIISNFEGSVPEIEDDPLASGNPTVGYGYVVQVNTTFYNNLNPSELFGQLVKIANNTYSPAVENFRAKYSMKMNQAQFDALVSFVFNVGVGNLNESSNYTSMVLVNAVNPTGISSSKPATGTLNVGSAVLRSDSSTTSTSLGTIPNGTKISISDYKAYRTDSKQEVWYKTTYNGKTGWISAGYVRLSGTWTHDLAWADSNVLANNFLQWNQAGGIVYPGLVWRRLAECKIFFFGDYEEAYHSNSNFTYNTYGFIFPDNCKDYDYRR